MDKFGHGFVPFVHSMPYAFMPNTVICFYEINEMMKDFILMVAVVFTNKSRV